jgi:hypothetical protein
MKKEFRIFKMVTLYDCKNSDYEETPKALVDFTYDVAGVLSYDSEDDAMSALAACAKIGEFMILPVYTKK